MSLGRLFCVALGVVLAYSAFNAIRRGQLKLRVGLDIRRKEDRAAFWASVLATLGLALICLALGLPIARH